MNSEEYLRFLQNLGIPFLSVGICCGKPFAWVDSEQHMRFIVEEDKWKEREGARLISSDTVTVDGTDVALTLYSVTDNEDGNCWCEDFYDLKVARRWLCNEDCTVEHSHHKDALILARKLAKEFPPEHPQHDAVQQWVKTRVRWLRW